MSFLDDYLTLENIAAIGAGFATGGAGFGLMASMGAGAAAGGGIAALQGKDVATGAIGGGLAGMTGGSLNAAFAPASASIGATAGTTGTTVAGNTAGDAYQQSLFTQPGSPADVIGTNYGGPEGIRSDNILAQQFTGGEGGALQGVTGYQPTDTSFMAGVGRFGGGNEFTGGGLKDKALGAGRLGITAAAPAIMNSLVPEEFDTFSRRGDKYDPNKQLNLNMDTGIDEALNKDSGLRFLAGGGYLSNGYLEGGEVEESINMSEGIASGMNDGMSDDIPAIIDGTQQAALSEGEYVIPADAVSHLGNGSSEAGATRLREMIGQLRMARTGREIQAPEIDPYEYMLS